MCVLHVITICTPNQQLIPFILTSIVLPAGRSILVNIKIIANFCYFVHSNCVNTLIYNVYQKEKMYVLHPFENTKYTNIR